MLLVAFRRDVFGKKWHRQLYLKDNAFGAFISTIVIRVIQINLSESLLESVAFEQLVLFIGLLIAGITGLIFSLLHAYASVNMKANQVISGTVL